MSICDGMNHDSNNAVFTEERPNRDVAVAPSCKTLKLELCEYELEANVDQSKPDFRLIDTKKLSNVKLESSDLGNQYETSETESETQLSSEFLSKGNLLPSKIKTEINVEELTSSCYALNDDIKFENFSVTVKSEEIDTDDLNIRNEAELNCNSGPSQKCHSVPKKVDKPVNKAVDAGEGEASCRNVPGESCPTNPNKTASRNSPVEPNISKNKSDQEATMIQCDYCTYKSKFRSHVARHAATVHKLGEKTFHCSQCDYTAQYNHIVKRHEFIHKSENEVIMFNCDYCTYKTRYKKSVVKHIANLHKIGQNQKIFKCDSCDYQTPYKFAIKRHEVVHKTEREVKMFQCNYCSFISKHKGSLINHLGTIHKVGYNRFKCEICEYETNDKIRITRHELVHKSEHEVTMFTCDYCHFKSKHKRSLTDHLRNIHKKQGKKRSM